MHPLPSTLYLLNQISSSPIPSYLLIKPCLLHLQMADPITGAAVSGLLKLIFDKLGSPLFKEIEGSFGVKTELKRLGGILSAIDAVLLDAEEQQTTLRSVRDWLLNLKDVAHDIEDVLDLISTQALDDKVRQRTLLPMVRKLFPQFGLARKLRAICGRLEEISANRRDFNFQERQVSVAHTHGERDQSPFIHESSAFGRKQDQDWMVSRLVSSSSDHENSKIPVLPIVGIGGMGKTTLAKLVFNDPRIEENFKIKLWASMPNEFSKKTAIEKIFECATREKASDSNMQTIEKTVHDILAGKTFLLVLDNVWASTLSILSGQTFVKEWSDLMEFLAVGSKSSRIIATTREDTVVSIARTMEAYKLEPLSEDACWSVFVKYAFRDGEEKECRSLVKIGKEIVRKCHGVPLAARTLGSQLWNDRDELHWKRIEESKLWEMKQAPDDILLALKLSFDQLPFILKSCFSFCSIRTTNDCIYRDEMVTYWMALGLIESREMNETHAEIGTRYLNELVSRSFIEVIHAAQYYQEKLKDATDPARFSEMFDLMDSSKIFKIGNAFQMHDLVHELGRYVAGEETAFVSFDKHEVSTRVKYLVWTEDNFFEREFPYQLLKAKKARSLLFDSKKGVHMSTSFLHNLISKFRCLRILSLGGFEFEELPNSIGDLKHLRLLNLFRNSKLKRLPDSMSKLVNLQTLIVEECRQLQVFPRNIHRWISLRQLYFTSKLDSCLETCYHGWTSILKIGIRDCAYLTSLSEKIGTLTTLRVLFIADCPNLASLPNNIQLLTALEELCIQNCEKLNLSGWEGLNGLRNLRILFIQNLPLLEHFPDGLQHCTSLLKLLIISCVSFSTLPRGIKALNSLQVLWIEGNNPIMRSRCEREIGEDWNLISHIRTVFVR